MKRPSKKELIREDQPPRQVSAFFTELAGEIRTGPLLDATDRPFGSLGYVPHWATLPDKTVIAGVLHGTGLSFYFEFHNDKQAEEIAPLREAMAVAPRAIRKDAQGFPIPVTIVQPV